MLKSSVGYSINQDSFIAGKEAMESIRDNISNSKINLVFTSEKNDIKKVVEGISAVNKAPMIGCTSCDGLIVPDGVITSPDGFVGIMSFEDKNMTVGVAAHAAGKDPRAIGKTVAIEAVQNAKTSRAPAYFLMIASPKEEEEYLMGIQDVIGRVPMFGGSAADDEVKGNWKIICNEKVYDDGVAVAFFYTDNEIITSFAGGYKETKNIGLITEVKDDRTLVSIDGISALRKYAGWINKTPESLRGTKLLESSITKPLGIKDPLGNLTVIRHPMFGNDEGTKTTTDDTISLGNKVVPGTAIIQLEATEDDLIDSTGETLRNLRKKMFTNPAAYVLFHCGGRKKAITNRLDEVHKQLVKETKSVPFIMPFTFGQYGYDGHSANICGGLMLSFTVFGEE